MNFFFFSSISRYIKWKIIFKKLKQTKLLILDAKNISLSIGWPSKVVNIFLGLVSLIILEIVKNRIKFIIELLDNEKSAAKNNNLFSSMLFFFFA